MLGFQRTVFYLMIPMHLLCIGWVWLGRIPFGIAGWMMIIFAFTAVPVMLIGLTVTSILAFTQRIPAERGRLNPAQALVHIALWLATTAYGFFVVDATDATNSDRSVFTLVAGDDAVETSFRLSNICLGLAALLYVLLLVLLVVGQRNRRRDHVEDDARHGPVHPAQPPRRR